MSKPLEIALDDVDLGLALDACPQCGNEDYESEETLLTYPSQTRCCCPSCGHRWTRSDGNG